MSSITITVNGVNMYRDSSRGAETPLISFVGIGTSNVAPTSGDITLGAEVERKAVTSYVDGTTGLVYVSMYIAPSDCVGVNIEEIGFFGGGAATADANTGILLAHGLFHHPSKTILESIQTQLALNFVAV